LKPIQKIEKSQFNAANRENILSINVRIDGFSFIISNKESIIVGEKYEWQAKDWLFAYNKIKDILNLQKKFDNSFLKVICIIHSCDSCLIPDEFYSKDQEKFALETYLGKSDLKVLSTKLRLLSAHFIFGIYPAIYSLFINKFPNIITYNKSAFDIDMALKEADEKSTLIIEIVKQEFEIIAIKSKELIAHNFFQFQTADEFMFLLLSFVKQNDFDTEKLELKIKGNLLMDSKIGVKLDKYFRNIHFKKPTSDKKEDAFNSLLNYTQIANN